MRPLALACCIAASLPACASFQQPGEALGARLGPDARYVHTRSGRAVYTLSLIHISEPTRPY